MKSLSASAAIAAFAALTIAPAAAAPDDAPPGPGRFFERLDTNGDGSVTREEMAAPQRDAFDRADANGDGAVTKDELEAMRQARRAEMRARMFPDADGDGTVSRREFEAASEKRFDALDANKDGVLTQEEIQQAAKKRAPKRR